MIPWVLFGMYIGIAVMVFFINAVLWNDYRDTDFLDEERRQTARRAFMAPIWPVLALRSLRDLWQDANQESK
jgi:hypothetical protein